MLDSRFLDELRSRTLLSGLIGKQLKLQRAGREWKACCPFHKEKTPSFYINDDKGFFHCFGCSAHGDAIKWLTDARGLSFMDAVKDLAQAAGMEVPEPSPQAREKAERIATLHEVTEAARRWYENNFKSARGSEARAYLSHRGISEDLREAFAIGYAPDERSHLKSGLAEIDENRLLEAGLLISVEGKQTYDRFRGRLMFPVRDPRGNTIAFGGRVLGSGEPKYLNSPDTPLFDKGRTLYNLDRAAPAARKSGRLIVVEGYMDVIALAGAGIEHAVAPLGTALTEDQLSILWRHVDAPILCFDGDSAGRKAATRAAIRALPLLPPGKSLNFATLPSGLDPDDLVKEGGAKAFEKVVDERVALDQLIWEAEYEVADLETPEGRASFGRRLRELARTISDFDVRTQYLALYKQKIYDFFVPNAGSSRITQGGKWLKSRRSAHPHLKAIADYGMDKAVFAPAALEGLRAYPAVISSHAEIVGAVSTILMHFELRQVCREMLDAALGNPDLDRESLEKALVVAGLAGTVQKLNRRSRVPFSFLQPSADPEKATRDLAAVLELLAATPEVKAALEEATEKLNANGTQEAFAEQLRVRDVLDRLTRDWADLLQAQAEAA